MRDVIPKNDAPALKPDLVFRFTTPRRLLSSRPLADEGGMRGRNVLANGRVRTAGGCVSRLRGAAGADDAADPQGHAGEEGLSVKDTPGARSEGHRHYPAWHRRRRGSGEAA